MVDLEKTVDSSEASSSYCHNEGMKNGTNGEIGYSGAGRYIDLRTGRFVSSWKAYLTLTKYLDRDKPKFDTRFDWGFDSRVGWARVH